MLTRREILRAAGEVFGDLGYEATTISDILTRAGVTKGALYFHFSSKEDLAQGLLNTQVECVPEPPDTGLFLQAVIDRGMILAHLMPRDPLVRGSARLAVDIQKWPGAQEWRPHAEWTKAAAHDLRLARDHGELLPHADVEEIAELLVGSFTGLQLMSQVVSGLTDLEERASVLFRTVLSTVTRPAVLGRLDMAPGRGGRVVKLIEEAESAGQTSGTASGTASGTSSAAASGAISVPAPATASEAGAGTISEAAPATATGSAPGTTSGESAAGPAVLDRAAPAPAP
ncbi:ScbR family autoregulator-binding transcription factor [Streptomyces sp. TS71-3]|uniref:ScbR family autoregulator-binding transcription factor n=1 Tax=Streptomyces sp. TS71-3 TaxID=2733862 RepID=UPI00201807D4|nr:ScbR family autoregulator-binding transcription factor [Streptomyces sp. TS71-3]